MKIYILIITFVTSITAFANMLTVEGLYPNHAVVKEDQKYYWLSPGESTPNGMTLKKLDSQQAWFDNGGIIRPYELDDDMYCQRRDSNTLLFIEPDERGLYITTGEVNGKWTPFLVDTGASHIAMNETDAKRFGIDYKKDGVPVNTDTAGGRTKAYAVRINEVKVGNIVVKNAKALILPGTLSRNVLLGMSFIEQIHMRNRGNVLELWQ